jgi:hypothetical protein
MLAERKENGMEVGRLMRPTIRTLIAKEQTGPKPFQKRGMSEKPDKYINYYEL